MGARQTTDSAEFNRLQQAYNQAIEAFEAATQNKKTAKTAYKKAVKAKADKQTQFLAFHELESAALLKRLRAFQMETAKNELKTFVKAQPKVEKSQKQEADAMVITTPAEMEDAIELESQVEVLSAPAGMHVVHEDAAAHTVHVKGFMPASLEEIAEAQEMPTIMPVALVEVFDYQAIVKDVAEHQAIAQTCEALDAADAKLEVIAALEALEAEKEVEIARAIEHHAIAQTCEALDAADVKQIVEEYPAAIMGAIAPEEDEIQLVDYQVVAGDATPEMSEAAIIAQPVMSTGEAIIVLKLPANTPADAPIYMAGNFNNWVANDENYKMNLHADGNYAITIHPPLGKVEFKLTRGNWEATEGDHYVNHHFECTEIPITFTAQVSAWRDLGTPAIAETHVIEYQSVAEVADVIEPHEVAPIVETHVIEYQSVAEVADVIEPHEVAPIVETHVIEYQSVAEVADVIEPHEVAPIVETHVIEYQSVAEVADVIEHHEVAPIVETHVIEYQSVAEVADVIEPHEVASIVETHVIEYQSVAEVADVIEPHEVAPIVEPHVIEYQSVAEVADVIESHEVAPIVETHVIDYQSVAEVADVIEPHEIAPVMETEVIQHHAMAAMPEIELNEVITSNEVVETSIPVTQVIESQTIMSVKEEEHLQDGYDHWERNQKFIGDDLKIIEGIGPKIEQLLNDIGILTYRQLSLMKVEFLEELLKTAGKRYASHDPATWPAQAKLAAIGKMAELKRLQERIHYGSLDA
jgi:predicted flap endonuclease-1-like 5' DNA nuclease